MQQRANKQRRSPNKINGRIHQAKPAFASETTGTAAGAILTGVVDVCSTTTGVTSTGALIGALQASVPAGMIGTTGIIAAAAVQLQHFLKET